MTVEATRVGPSEPVYSVPALEKGLEVLEHLSRAHQPLGMPEIAQALGRSRQELFRILVCLHTQGYLLRDDAARYRLSSKMFEVGSRHFAHQALVSLAMPSMEELAVTSGEACQLSIVDRERLLVVATATGSSYLQLGVKVGTSIPIHNSVIGFLAIAFLPEDQHADAWNRRKEIVQQGGDVYLSEIQSLSTWTEKLHGVRKAGILVAPSPMHPGSRVHAAPIVDGIAGLVAILSLTRLLASNEPRQRQREFERALVDCACSISERLGLKEGSSSPFRSR